MRVSGIWLWIEVCCHNTQMNDIQLLLPVIIFSRRVFFSREDCNLLGLLDTYAQNSAAVHQKNLFL